MICLCTARALVGAVSSFHLFSIHLWINANIANRCAPKTGCRRMFEGQTKVRSVRVVGERVGGGQRGYQLTSSCNPKTNWLECYEHVCIEMVSSVHVCMANMRHMEEGLHLNYYEWGKCALYDCRLHARVFTIWLGIDRLGQIFNNYHNIDIGGSKYGTIWFLLSNRFIAVFFPLLACC